MAGSTRLLPLRTRETVAMLTCATEAISLSPNLLFLGWMSLMRFQAIPGCGLWAACLSNCFVRRFQSGEKSPGWVKVGRRRWLRFFHTHLLQYRKISRAAIEKGRKASLVIPHGSYH